VGNFTLQMPNMAHGRDDKGYCLLERFCSWDLEITERHHSNVDKVEAKQKLRKYKLRY
jgi:hypothetical protein